MSSDTVDNNIHRVRARRYHIQRNKDFSRRSICFHVECQRIVRFWKPLIKPILEHSPCTRNAFLCRLTNQHERTGPVITALRHLSRSADQGRDMNIMTAGVHHRLFNSGSVHLGCL